MRVRFWGTRGSIPKPGPSTLRYGGNTSCIEVVADDGTRVVIDCGTGAHELSRALLSGAAAAPCGHLLVTHMHWDHIQGFPFFDPLFAEGSTWDVYAPAGRPQHARGALGRQMSYDHHPVSIESGRGTLRFHDLAEGSFQAGSIRITSQYLNHPALTLGYRLEADGCAVVYASDHEPHALPQPGAAPGEFAHLEDRRHLRFLDGADLVIHDAQYALADFPAKAGWGHSPVEAAADYAVAARAGRVALHHHDPSRDDAGVERLAELAQRRAARAQCAPEVFAAREGEEIRLAARAGAARCAPASARSALLAPEPPRHATVWVIAKRSDAAAEIAAALEAEPVRVLACRDATAALRDAAQEQAPALVLVERDGAIERDLDACHALRESQRLAGVPVVVIAGAQDRAEDMDAAFAAGAADYLSRPLKATLLRARVRSWLMRASPD